MNKNSVGGIIFIGEKHNIQTSLESRGTLKMHSNDKRLDVIQEVINCSIGKSTSSLNKTYSSHLLIQIPKIQINGNSYSDQSFTIPKNEYFSCITMDFTRDIQGRSHIILLKKNVLQMITNLLHVSLETPGFDNFMTSAMVEIGTMLIHSIIGSFCKILHSNVEFSIPDYFEGTGEILSHWNEHSAQFIQIEAQTHFILESVRLSGFIFLFMDLNRFDDLVEKLKYLSNSHIALQKI